MDYRDWRIAVLFKNKNSAASNKSYFSIAPETLNKIVKMKENINRNRTNFDPCHLCSKPFLFLFE